MTYSNRAVLLSGISAFCLAFVPAQAQSVDYGAAEEVFGEPVTTSATGSPQRASDTPADMQIISADEIRQSGEPSLPGILQRVAGIDVLNESAGSSDVNIRGYDQSASPRLLVLVNGRQVYLDHFGLAVWANIPVQLSEIRQIEVVKGPGSALFGFNAVSGVINIITYNPKFDKKNMVTASVGDHGQGSGSVATTFDLGDSVFARLSGGVQQANEWARTGALPPTSSLHDPRSLSAALDVVAQLAPKTELRVNSSWSNIQNDLLVGASYSVQKLVNTSEMATLTSDTDFGTIQAQVYQNQLSAKFNFVAAGGPNYVNTITVASLQDLFKIGTDNTLRIAGEYRHNSLNTSPATGGTVSYDVFSGSAMWNWVITDQITTTSAVRVDMLKLHRSGTFASRVPLANNSAWDRTITEPSLNFTAAWRPSATDTIRLSYARGVETPSLTSLGGFQDPVAVSPTFTFDLIGNPNLKPTIVNNYELAYDHQFSWAKFGVRAFMQNWTNLICNTLAIAAFDFAPTATTNAAIWNVNTSNSKMKGVEVTGSGKIAYGATWRADYTYTDVKDTYYPGVNAVARYVAFQSTSPKYRGNVGLSWTDGTWEADANLHYVGNFLFYDMTNGALQPVKAFATLSSRLAYRTDIGVTLALSGQNLTNGRQAQTRGLEAERRVQFTVSKDW